MCEEKGWEPFQLKILKSDIGLYIDRNQDWVDSQLKTAMQKEKVEFLESIIKSLNGRGFNINAAINWEKFKVLNSVMNPIIYQLQHLIVLLFLQCFPHRRHRNI